MLIDTSKRDAAKDRAKLKSERLEKALAAVAQTPDGREALVWILSQCHMGCRLDFTEKETALHNLGVNILAETRKAAPEAARLILEEAVWGEG